MITHRLKPWSAVLAALLLCRSVAAQEPDIASAVDIIKQSAASEWDTKLSRAHPEAEKRLKPFFEYLKSGVLPEIRYDATETPTLSSSEMGMYISEEDVILLHSALRSVPAQVMATVLVHELRHRFDRQIQKRWIGSDEANSVDGEFRAFEAQVLFWSWARPNTRLPQERVEIISQLDGRLDDMERGMLRDMVEIIYDEPTAAQRLVTVTRRVKLIEELLNDLPEGANIDTLNRRLRMYEEEKSLIHEDLKLQSQGL
ncbi:MAG: hypothetical protein AAB268_08600 [Elusimicrobiota bacterium]